MEGFMKPYILLILTILLLTGCSKKFYVEPDKNADTLLLGQVQFLGSNDNELNSFNGKRNRNISLEIENINNKKCMIIRSADDAGIFYSSRLEQGIYQIKKFTVQSSDNGRFHNTTFNQYYFFQLQKGKINNMGFIDWKLNFKNSKEVILLNSDFSNVKMCFSTNFNDSSWITNVWTDTIISSKDLMDYKNMADKTTNLNLKNRMKESSLLYDAVVYNNIDAVNYILSKGADINLRDPSNGETPLMMAAAHDNLQMIKLLIEKGADVNIRNNNNDLPIHRCAEYGNLEIAKFLAENGSSLNVNNSDGNTPLKISEKYSNISIADYLRSKGVKE
jgi:hypothetical protein